ncbi:UNVERIFIED_CONTAM: hypothetical protein GTU68_019525 [Idotea baltica]|nr:hypothetical protein [Idotea baltica]
MITAIVVLVGLAVLFGLILGYASVKFKVEGDPLVDQVDNLLPQTQCGQCSYAGCRPYAEAIANGEVAINKCPPGGESTILALADLLDVEPLELDEEAELMHTVIEDECTGCDLCLPPCPVDCIVMVPRKTTTSNWKWHEPKAIEDSLVENQYPVIPLIPVTTQIENSLDEKNVEETSTKKETAEVDS